MEPKEFTKEQQFQIIADYLKNPEFSELTCDYNRVMLIAVELSEEYSFLMMFDKQGAIAKGLAPVAITVFLADRSEQVCIATDDEPLGAWRKAVAMAIYHKKIMESTRDYDA